MLQANERTWVRQIGSIDFDQANGIYMDTDGGVVVVGSFSNILKFEGFQRIFNCGNKDLFTAKYDSTGKLIWFRTIGSRGNDIALNVIVDNKGDNVLIGMSGSDSVHFGSVVLPSLGKTDILVAKYSTEGIRIWAKNFGGSGTDRGTAIVYDNEENYLITGWFHGRAHFDNINFVPVGRGDVFIAKLDPQGNVIWAKRAGGAGEDLGQAITADALGNSYVAGDFLETAYFGDDSLISKGNYDIFVAKYDRAGEVVWIKNFGGSKDDRATGIVYDHKNDNLVLTGSFTGQLQFDGTSQILLAEDADDQDMLLVCMDSDGTMKWALSQGGQAPDAGKSVQIDPSGNIYVSGVFSETMNIGANTLRSLGQLDGFIAKYDPFGQPVWITHAGGGPDDDFADAIAPSLSGSEVFVTGSFSGSATFRNQTIQSNGDFDAFVERRIEFFETATLKPAIQSPQFVGAEYSIDVKVGESENIHSITFDLNYSSSEFIQIKQPLTSAVEPGPYLGEDASVTATTDEINGKITITARRNQPFVPKENEDVLVKVYFIASKSTPFDTESEMFFDNITAQNEFGEQVFVTPENGKVKLVGVGVWPGDTNNDGIVNEADVLPIGQFFNNTGPARINRSLQWKEQLTVPWDKFFSTFADADGDGVVRLQDVFAIGLNWKRTVKNVSLAINKASQTGSTNFPATSTIFMQAETKTSSSEVWIEVIADSVQDLFGLAFEMTYPVSPGILVKQIDNGVLMADPIYFTNHDTLNGKISVAMSQKGNVGGVNGSGSVSKILFDIGSYPLSDFLNNLAIVSVSAIDSKGQEITFQIGTDIIITDVAEKPDALVPDDFVLYPNSPNPFNPSTTIRYDLPEQTNVRLTIFDQLGKIVKILLDERQGIGQHIVNWNGRDEFGNQVPSGVYIYLIKTDRFMKARRMMLVK
jgi:hypothetical protein